MMNLRLWTLIILFGIGFLTWFLALVRTFALIEHRKLSLCMLIFVEEMVMLWIGIWLARHGAIPETISCALGGSVAAFVVMSKKIRHFRDDRSGSQLGENNGGCM